MTPRRLSLTFLLLLATLLLSVVAAWRASVRVLRNEQAVLHTQQVISELRGLQSAVMDAEAAKYAFVYGDRLDYLTPYYRAGDSIRTHVERIASLTADNPQQQERAHYLKDAATATYARIDSVVTLRRLRGRAAAAPYVSDERSNRMLARVRLIVDEMSGAEEALMSVRSRDSQQSINQMVATFVFVTLLAVGLVAALFRFARRDLELQQIEAEGMAASNERLTAAVDERTGELRHANAHLQGLTEELQRSNRELQDFAYVASHDLQEPLRKIRAFSDLLQHEYTARLDDEGKHFLSRIDDAASRMSRLISDLLAYSRVNTKAAASGPVPLDPVVASVLDDLQVAQADAHAEVRVQPLPTVQADAGQMHQLFQNLLGNAFKFRQPGEPAHVEVWSEPDAPHPLTGQPMVRVLVRDHGIGFDEKYAERIFAPFERLHARTNYDGTGIGLAVCRRIVERNGGSIRVRSAEGKGTTFTVTLPAVEEA